MSRSTMHMYAPVYCGHPIYKPTFLIHAGPNVSIVVDKFSFNVLYPSADSSLSHTESCV